MKISALKILSTSLALLTGASVLSIGGRALAQSATFNFNTDVTAGCDLNAGGFLAGDNNTTLAVNSANNGLETITPSTFTIECNFTGAQVNVDSISTVAEETVADTVTATLEKTNRTTGTSTSTGGAGDTVLDLEAGSPANTFEVGLTTDHSGNGLIAGTYSYNVLVTVTGNN